MRGGIRHPPTPDELHLRSRAVPTDSRFPITWELESLLPHPGSAAFQDVFNEFAGDLERVAADSDALPEVKGDSPGSATWVRFLREYENISRRAADLEACIECHCAAEAENKESQRLEARLSALEPHRERMATNIELALRNAAEDDFAALLRSDPYLEQIEYSLRDS